MNLKTFRIISEGLIVGPKFEGRLARVRHDTVARTEGMRLQMTNEVFPCRPVQDGKVNPNSKIITKLANRPEWVNRFREMMGAFVWLLK